MPTDPAIPQIPNPDYRLMARLADLERRLAAVEARDALPVVTALPAFGKRGRVVFLTTDGKLYRDTGTAWILNS